jgi:hypothetical protein
MKSNLGCLEFYCLLCINFKSNAEGELKLLNAETGEIVYIKSMDGMSWVQLDNNNKKLTLFYYYSQTCLK